MYEGDYNLTETVHLLVNTFTSDDPSASSTVTDLAAGDIEIHKDGSTTKRSSDSGVTVSINFGSITGNHMVHIDLSDNTDAGYYSVGSRYQVRLEGITVDAGALNVWIGSFSIGCMMRPTTAGRTLDILSTGEVAANLTMILGHLLTNTGTQIADAFETMFDVASPVLLASTVMRGTDGANTTVPDAAGTAPTAVEIQAEMEENAASILDTLRDDLADGGRLDLLIDGIKAVTDALPDAGALSDLAAILTDTNELQTDNIPGTLATIAGYLDTEIAAIKAVTDNLPDAGALTTIGTDTARLTAVRAAVLTDWIDGGRLDLLLDAIKVIADALTAAAATKLALSAGTIVTGTVSWDNTNATTTVFYSDDITEATADHFNGRIVIFTSGALQYQASDISDYELASGEGKFTITALTEAPADNSTFIIV